MCYSNIYNKSMLSTGNKRLRQIVVDEKNYEALRLLGHARDSFNDVVTRLLQQQNQIPPLVSQVSSSRYQGAESDHSSQEGGNSPVS